MSTDQHPSGYFLTHRIQARVENARWLTEQGYTPAQIAARLGVSVTCIEKDLAR